MKIVINVVGELNGIAGLVVDLADRGHEVVVNIGGKAMEAVDVEVKGEDIDVVKALNDYCEKDVVKVVEEGESDIEAYRDALKKKLKNDYHVKWWVSSGWEWFAVDEDGTAYLYKHSPEVSFNDDAEWDIVRVGDDWNDLDGYFDATYWKDSLIHLKELV